MAVCFSAAFAANDSTLAVRASIELPDRVRSLAAARKRSEMILSTSADVSTASEAASTPRIALRVDLR